MREPQTCFISAPASSIRGLANLRRLLTDRGLRVVVPDELPRHGELWASLLRETLKKVDLVIAVMPANAGLLNVAFELGVAHALEKRVLILVENDVEKVPSDLHGMFQVRVSMNDTTALEFALDQIVAAPAARRPRIDRQEKFKPLGIQADVLLQHLESVNKAATPWGLEHVVESILHYTGVTPVASNFQHSGPAFDFAAWIDELEPYIGNPVAIEVARDLNEHTIERLFDSLSLGAAQWVVLIYLNEPDVMIQLPPTILAFNIRELLQRLRTRSLPAIIRDRRNEIVHGTAG